MWTRTIRTADPITLGQTMTGRRTQLLAVFILLQGSLAWADPPTAAYIFPAGGQRGATVAFKVGGSNLFKSCGFEMLGAGIQAPKELQRTSTLWFEGPVLPLPDSQQAEDYPKDMAGKVRIAADAPAGARNWHVWTSQGACPSMKFVVGELPEVIEDEIDGPALPVAVSLPVTVNGRIFPREDVDVWKFTAVKGRTITAQVAAAGLGSPLDARLEVLDPAGRTIAENDDFAGADPLVCFTAPSDGTYRVKIHDIRHLGGQAFVYRLTLSEGPRVERVYPLGARRGSRARFELSGTGLSVNAAEFDLPAGAPAAYTHRISFAGETTNAFVLDLDDLPEHREGEPATDKPGSGGPVALPAVLNGRIARVGEVDEWSFAAAKGEAWELDLRAARLGSPLDGVIVVLDAAGKELSRAEGAAPRVDPTLIFTAPADGAYRIRIESRFRSRAGSDFAYRLRIAKPPAPDFRLRLAVDAVTVLRGATTKMKVSVERIGGFAEAIALEIDGLPAGVTATGTNIAAKQATVDVLLKADEKAAIAVSRITVRGKAKIGGDVATRIASAGAAGEVAGALLAVGLPTPFKVKGDFDYKWAGRGTTSSRKFRIERGGFDGPLEIELADKQMRHLQGVTGAKVVIPAGATEFEYVIHLPPWMETGRTCRAVVAAVGVVVEPDGSRHEVGYSSVQPNEQIVAVIEPGPLAIEIDPGSVAADPGTTAVISVKIRRARTLAGPVRLLLSVPAGMTGISADPIEVPADKGDAELVIRFAADMRGRLGAPLTVSAIVVNAGSRVVAEAKLDVSRTR